MAGRRLQNMRYKSIQMSSSCRSHAKWHISLIVARQKSLQNGYEYVLGVVLLDELGKRLASICGFCGAGKSLFARAAFTRLFQLHTGADVCKAESN